MFLMFLFVFLKKKDMGFVVGLISSSITIRFICSVPSAGEVLKLQSNDIEGTMLLLKLILTDYLTLTDHRIRGTPNWTKRKFG